MLIADAWAGPGSPWNLLPGDAGRRLRERYSADLETAPVCDFTASLVVHEASWRTQGLSGWSLPIARNRWFQKKAAARLQSIDVANGVVFAHSYAALDIFRTARKRGMTTVLGQIDPGEAHVKTLEDVASRWPEFGPPLAAPPPEYFSNWREECRLADCIVVNSEWSRDSLQRAGVSTSKLRVIPLPFESDSDGSFQRIYPDAFTPERPLRVLFVGSVAAFKGVPSILEALDRVGDLPVECQFVGPIAATIPERYMADRRIRFTGAVSRSEVMNYYRDSDVLLFPSHSDGFGMAQVEARVWRLPIIASRSCGRIVEDGVNGLVLPEVSGDAIANALREIIKPGVLARLSSSAATKGLMLDDFGEALAELVTSG
jgi:glycosyltransferase involved in cell wall biosynthesis